MIQQISDQAQKRAISARILGELPDWFGIPEYTKKYVDESADMPFWADVTGETAVGFAALRETSPHAAEVYVMGVLPALRGKGVGRRLFFALYDYAKAHGYAFLQVKTVKNGVYPEYDETNAFYRRMGFLELECFPTLWDEWNPCQVYVMSLSESGR